MKYISIFGYYGFGNTGDDSVLWSLLSDLRKEKYDGTIVVFSNNPDETERMYKKFDVVAIRWDDFYLLNLVILKSNLLIIGGGGLYNCYFDYPQEFFLKGNHRFFSVTTFGLPYLAEVWKTPCMICGVGASEILSEDAKRHIGKSFEKCDVITVRDNKTKEIFENLMRSPNSKQIVVTADPVFRLWENMQENDMETEDIVSQIENLEKPIMGISLRNWDYRGEENKVIEAICQTIAMFYERNGGSIVFLPFDNGGVVKRLSEDKKVFDKVLLNIDISNIQIFYPTDYLSPDMALRMIKKCDIVISMRLHPIVMSISSNVPVVGIEYDQKVRNIMTMCHLEDDCIAIEDVSAELIIKKINGIRRNMDVSEMMKSKALENISYIFELVNKKEECRPYEDEFPIKMLKREFEEKIMSYHDNVVENSFNTGKYRDYLRWSSIIQEENYSAVLLYRKAFSLHQVGDFNNALIYYEKAEGAGFDKFWILYNRGQLYLALRKYKEAWNDLSAARELNEEHEGLKDLFFSVKKYDENCEYRY